MITPLVRGVLREIWRESVAQGGGVGQVVYTGIRVSAANLCRVEGLLTVDTVVGSPLITATPYLAGGDGLLRVAVSNIAAGGNTATWTLDVKLLQSPNQANRGANGYIMVAGGATSGLAAPQTLAQTYTLGAVQGDQTMTITNADNPGTIGIIIDGSTAGVTGNGVSLEIRQHADHAVPVLFSRWGNIAAGPNLQFSKARGTYGVPAVLNAGDELGTIDFYSYNVDAFTLDARIVATTRLASPDHGVGLDFHITSANIVRHQAMTLYGHGPSEGSVTILKLYTSPYVLPDVTNTGSLGNSTLRWNGLYCDDAWVYKNILLGGLWAAGGGAELTLVLHNTSVMPVPQANQVYIGSNDFGVNAGSNLAVLEISAEEPPVAVGAAVVDMLIPLRYNGRKFYLHATELDVG